jgi:hypothetical protein
MGWQGHELLDSGRSNTSVVSASSGFPELLETVQIYADVAKRLIGGIFEALLEAVEIESWISKLFSKSQGFSDTVFMRARIQAEIARMIDRFLFFSHMDNFFGNGILDSVEISHACARLSRSATEAFSNRAGAWQDLPT